MIRSVIIINGSGVCIFHQNLGGSTEPDGDPDAGIQLVSGFLYSLDIFAKVKNKENRIKMLRMSDSVYYFEEKNGFIAVLETDGLENLRPEQYSILLAGILDKFIEHTQNIGYTAKDCAKIESGALESDIREIVSKMLRKILFAWR